MRRTSEITQARNLPQMPEGSDTTLLHQSGRAHQNEWGGQQKPVTNHQNTQVL